MKFAIVGIGYVASKHLEAIEAVGGELIAACDTRDSVGILDKYFLNTKFFKDDYGFETFLRGNLPDYLVICTPNFTHIDYLQMADRLGIQSICEKPIVNYLSELDKFSDTNCIVQLRYSPTVQLIQPREGVVRIIYYTPRGDWYWKSWKGDETLSGGLLLNIGVHLFDLMIHMYGAYSEPILIKDANLTKAGEFMAGQVKVKWILSVASGLFPIRNINGLEVITYGLHTKAYEEILAGRGIKKQDVKQSLELINEYRKLSKNIPVLRSKRQCNYR